MKNKVLILSILMFCTFATAFAADYKLVTDRKTNEYKRGEVFTLDLILIPSKDNKGNVIDSHNGMQLTIQDSNLLELQDVRVEKTNWEATRNGGSAIVNVNKANINKPNTYVNSDEKIATLVLKVKDDAPYKQNYSVLVRNVVISNKNFVSQAVADRGIMVSIIANNIKLEAKIKEANAYVEANYTPNTYSIFKTKLQEAVAVNLNKLATTEELTAALDNLQAAINGLKAYNKNLERLLLDYENLIKKDYILETFTPLELKVEAVKLVLAKPNATVEELATLEKELVALYANLRVDKTSLQFSITEAEKIDKTKYTEESAKIFTDALNSAKDILAKVSAAPLEVKNATSKLNKAIDALALKPAPVDPIKPQPPVPDKPNKPDKPVVKPKPINPNDSQIVNTGDLALVIAIAALIYVGIANVVIEIKS
ncbi:MAG: hypothetical protein RR702_05905 [Clostridia bacterium]